MKARWFAGALAVWSALSSSATAGPVSVQRVAIVTEVEGSALIIARGRTLSPDVADPVDEGAVVVLERGARIVLTYPMPGSIYELRGPGRFLARTNGVELSTGAGELFRRDLIPALRALQIKPQGSTLQGSAAMRGGNIAQLVVDGPTGSQLARDAIRLCWKSLGPQWTYRIRLIDDDGIVLFETRTPDSEFELPASLQLEADTLYLWHVLATGPNAQSAEAAGEFRRLAPASEQALLRAESLLPELDQTGRVLVRIARQQRGLAPESAPGCRANENPDLTSP